MNITKFLALPLLGTALLVGCGESHKTDTATHGADSTKTETAHAADDFQYFAEKFADLRIARYQIPGFEELNPQQKEMLYYLFEAAIAGRDIMYDQNYKHNLCIRKTLESIMNTYAGDKNSADYKAFDTYTKRVWFSNGIHHHYSNDKLMPEFSEAFFAEAVKGCGDALPLGEGETVDQLIAKLTPVMFDPTIDAKKVNQGDGIDLLATSAVNFYEGVTQAEAEAFYADKKANAENKRISFGLNSKLVKEDGKLVEKVWRVGGMYSPAIERIANWVEKAAGVAENEIQKKALTLLVEYYRTGDLAKFDEYCIAWVNDTDSRIDVVNGFIEVYNDPMGYRGSFESVVSIKDMEASKRIAAIGGEAQWFEDHSPIMDEHKKKNVKGISAKVITVVMESGDASPSTPIGINLPNANWIRAEHGSKSVNLGNIVHASEMAATGGGTLAEFIYSPEKLARLKEHGGIGDILHTDMHEVIGHASGQINEGVGTPKETLKSYSSCLEEGRADLVALYYLMDQKLVDMGVMSTLDVGRAAYDDYITNGLYRQIVRIKLGNDIEEAHMRNRSFISHWCLEKGAKDNVIEKKMKDGKTFYVVNDYEKLRVLFGELLKEIQRIKSEGDYEAGKNLVENYGVKIDQELHKEILERFAALKVAPYGGFINPTLVPVEKDGKIVDVKVEYPADFKSQMMNYGKNYSFLPAYN